MDLESKEIVNILVLIFFTKSWGSTPACGGVACQCRGPGEEEWRGNSMLQLICAALDSEREGQLDVLFEMFSSKMS